MYFILLSLWRDNKNDMKIWSHIFISFHIFIWKYEVHDTRDMHHFLLSNRTKPSYNDLIIQGMNEQWMNKWIQEDGESHRPLRKLLLKEEAWGLMNEGLLKKWALLVGVTNWMRHYWPWVNSDLCPQSTQRLCQPLGSNGAKAESASCPGSSIYWLCHLEPQLSHLG